jgi:four helix bundle protein
VAKIATYKDLDVWKKSFALVSEIYSNTDGFPSSEMFGLVSQIRRAAVSIPANIAEGWGRESTRSYVQHLKISRGSLFELSTTLEISRNLKFLSEENYSNINIQLIEISKMLNSMIFKLSEKLV